MEKEIVHACEKEREGEGGKLLREQREKWQRRVDDAGREYGGYSKRQRRGEIGEAEVGESLATPSTKGWVKRVYHLFTTRPQTADKNINVER